MNLSVVKLVVCCLTGLNEHPVHEEQVYFYFLHGMCSQQKALSVIYWDVQSSLPEFTQHARP